MSREAGRTSESTNPRLHACIYRNHRKSRSCPRQEGPPPSTGGLPSPSGEGLGVRDAEQALARPVTWHTAPTKRGLRDWPGRGKPSPPARAPSSGTGQAGHTRTPRTAASPLGVMQSPASPGRHGPWGLGHILPLPVHRAPPTHGLSLGPGSAPPGHCCGLCPPGSCTWALTQSCRRQG